MNKNSCSHLTSIQKENNKYQKTKFKEKVKIISYTKYWIKKRKVQKEIQQRNLNHPNHNKNKNLG